MALSGSVITNKVTATIQGYTFSMGMKCTWSVTQSIAENKSFLTWTLESDGGSGFSVWTGNVSLTINGDTVLSKPERFTMNGGGAWKETGTRALEIPHNNDGTKTFTINIVAGINAYTSSNCTGTGTFTLDTIPRALAYIVQSNGFAPHQSHIYEPSGWALYQPYIYTSSGWVLYT